MVMKRFMSIHSSVHLKISAAPTQQISLESDTGDLHGQLSRKLQMWLKISSTLREDVNAFYCCQLH
jgi:hypothetical protein